MGYNGKKRKSAKFVGDKSNNVSEMFEKHSEAVLEKLRKSMGNVSVAIEGLPIVRSTFYEWVKKYPEFAKKVDAIEESTIDMAESALKRNISKGDNTAIIFFLKTRGRDRGYVERYGIEHSVEGLTKDVLLEEQRKYLDKVYEAVLVESGEEVAQKVLESVNRDETPLKIESKVVDVEVKDANAESK